MKFLAQYADEDQSRKTINIPDQEAALRWAFMWEDYYCGVVEALYNDEGRLIWFKAHGWL